MSNNNYYELIVNTEIREAKIGMSLDSENQLDAEAKLMKKYELFPVGRSKGVATEFVPRIMEEEIEGLSRDDDVVATGDTSFTMLRTGVGFVGMIAPSLWEEYLNKEHKIYLMTENEKVPVKIIR